jgi:Ca2+-transporting ATPase
MTFISLSLGQLVYTLFCQRSDVRHIRPDRLSWRTARSMAPFSSRRVSPCYRSSCRCSGARSGLGGSACGDAGFALGTALIPAGAVLARRGVRLQLREVEGRPCETS